MMHVTRAHDMSVDITRDLVTLATKDKPELADCMGQEHPIISIQLPDDQESSLGFMKIRKEKLGFWTIKLPIQNRLVF